MSEGQTGTPMAGHVAMIAQGILLEAGLPAENERERRREITNALARTVLAISQRIAPRLVLEIGAHQAKFSRQAKRKLSEARVVAFEANPDVFAKHHERVTAAGVEFVDKAISDAPGTVRFTVPVRDGAKSVTTMGSLLEFGKASGEESHEVSAIPLDDFLGDDADLPSAIWVDVEGAIANVLRGATRTLAHCELFFVEVEPKALWPGQMLDQGVIETLADHGLVPVVRDIQRPRRQYNILFLRSRWLADPVVARALARFGRQVAGKKKEGPAAPAAESA